MSATRYPERRCSRCNVLFEPTREPQTTCDLCKPNHIEQAAIAWCLARARFNAERLRHPRPQQPALQATLQRLERDYIAACNTLHALCSERIAQTPVFLERRKDGT